MNDFDKKAQNWDKEKMHFERSQAIADEMIKMFPKSKQMTALEYGAGTGILSFMLSDRFEQISMMDSSTEMVAVMNKKIADANAKNLTAIFHDLESKPFFEQYDIIFNQMVMHHVVDIDKTLDSFKSLLKPNGYLVIADLYTEDGSFHGEDFSGHLGFEVDKLAGKLIDRGFKTGLLKECFTIVKQKPSGEMGEYPIFLIVAQL